MKRGGMKKKRGELSCVPFSFFCFFFFPSTLYKVQNKVLLGVSTTSS